MNSNTTLTLRCPKCGSDQLIQPDNANLESQLTCSACGASFPAMDATQTAVVNEAERLASEAARAALGKLLD